MAKENVHSGHRARVRKRYLSSGIDSFEMHELLELLLFYAIPMKNTSVLAHTLLDDFGSLSAIFDAPVDVLVNSGLTESQAVLLKLMPDISRIYLDDKHNDSNKVISSETVADKILRKFVGRENENILLLLLDAKGKEIFCGMVSNGTISDTTMPIRKIVDITLRYNAKAAIIAHNHPSGIALPSRDDLDATTNLKKALDLIGVRLLDHYIVADNDCVSIAQSSVLPTFFE